MRYIFLGLLGVFLMACATEVTISMDDGNPPTFKFSRNFSEVNTLPFFDVIQVAPENEVCHTSNSRCCGVSIRSFSTLVKSTATTERFTSTRRP